MLSVDSKGQESQVRTDREERDFLGASQRRGIRGATRRPRHAIRSSAHRRCAVSLYRMIECPSVHLAAAPGVDNHLGRTSSKDGSLDREVRAASRVPAAPPRHDIVVTGGAPGLRMVAAVCQG